MTISLRRRWGLGRPPLDVAFELNRNSPQALGLVAWWPALASRGANVLRELGGKVVSGIFKGPGEPGWAIDSELRWVLSFDGADDWVNLGTEENLAPGSGDWAIVSRVKPAVIDANYHYISMWRGTGYGRYETAIHNNYVAVSFEDADGNGSLNVNMGGVLVANNWYDIATVVQRPHIYVYINGVRTASDFDISGVGSLTGTSQAYISHATYTFRGLLQSELMYNRALSPAEIWQLWDPATRWDLYRPLRWQWVVKWPWVISECRLYEVPLDLRTYKVPIEQRVKTILRETRTIKVPCEGHG